MPHQPVLQPYFPRFRSMETVYLRVSHLCNENISCVLCWTKPDVLILVSFLMFPPVRAASIQCTKIPVQAGLSDCCRLQSSSAAVRDPAGCYFSLRLVGYVDCAADGWSLNFADEQPDPSDRCKSLSRGGAWSDRGHGLRYHSSRVCKLCAFKLFGLPGSWQ